MDLFTYLMAKNDHNTSVKKDLFSYLLGKNQSGTYTDYSGTSLSINNTKKGKMAITLKGNTSQTGTPTPDNPIPVNVVSGDNEVVVCGINIWDEQWEVGGIDNSTGQNETTTSIIRSKNYISVLPSTNYYFKTPEGTSKNLTIFWYDINKNFISLNWVQNAISQAPNNAYYLRFKFGSAYGTTYNNDVSVNVSNASINGTYYPYQSQTYEVDLGNIELCKIGDYQDYFTKNSDGQWCKYNAIGKYTFTGNETPNSITGGYYYYMSALGNITYNIGGFNTKFQFVNDDRITANDPAMYYLSDNQMAFRVGSTKDRLYIKTQLSSSDLKSTLANTPLYYVLATPYLSLIEDNNLIEQLDNLEKAQSYKGTTNISQVNNDLSFEMEVKIKVGS